MTNPTWAGRSATPPKPGDSGSHDDDKRASWVPTIGVIAAVGLVGVGGYLVGSATGMTAAEAASTQPTAVSSDAGDEFVADESTTEGALRSDAVVQAPDTEASGDETAGDEATTDTDESSNTNTPVDTDRDDSLQDDSDHQVVVAEGEVRGAVLRDGILYLGGEVPSREVADQIIERAAAVVGENNVVDEYMINPEATMEQGAPLYVDDVVLFAYGSNRFDPAFEPLLDLGLALLQQNPTVTVTIVTHTDASGSTTFNDRLSYQRGEWVAQYWIDRGVPVEQIAIDARGERDPRAENDSDEGAQLNRRAEFYIEGLLP